MLENNTTMFELEIIKSGARTNGQFWFIGVTESKANPDGFIIPNKAYIFGHVENKFPLGTKLSIPEVLCKELK